MKTSYTAEQMDNMMEQFTLACRNAGLKVTHQRTEIYRNLLITPDHPSAETLHKRLLPSLPTISLDTVYRTLATLEQYGLIAKIQTAESQGRFEAVCGPHHHLICSQCRKVMDFKWPEIDTLELPAEVNHWGDINSKNVVMYGVCNTCSSS